MSCLGGTILHWGYSSRCLLSRLRRSSEIVLLEKTVGKNLLYNGRGNRQGLRYIGSSSGRSRSPLASGAMRNPGYDDARLRRLHRRTARYQKTVGVTIASLRDGNGKTRHQDHGEKSQNRGGSSFGFIDQSRDSSRLRFQCNENSSLARNCYCPAYLHVKNYILNAIMSKRK